MASNDLILGIDLGTQSTKVLVYDPERRQVVAIEQAPLSIVQHGDGTSEQDPAWWVEAFRSCMSRLDPQHLGRVGAIGVSGQQHGLVALGARHDVLVRAKLWNDTSTAEECELITAAAGGQERLIREVGNPILPGYTAPKLLWLKRHAPEAYARLAHVLLPHDYLNFYLTGELSTEFGDASGTAFFDVRKRSWSPLVLSAIDPDRDLSACLPRLIGPSDPIGQLRPELADELRLPRTALVCAGGGDNMMAAIGTGCVTPGVFTVSLGTSGTVYAYSDQPVVDPQGIVAAFCSSTGGWLPLACTMNCTVATELVRQVFKLPVEELDGLGALAPEGSDGLITLPFYSGERTPNLPHGRGCVLGLTPQTFRRTHLVRSAMEGAVFALRYGLGAFEKLGAAPAEIRLTGGGSRSRIFRQLAADIFGCPVNCPKVTESAAFGAALQALWMLEGQRQRLRSIAELVSEHVESDDQALSPNPANQETYTAVYGQYLRYLELLRPEFV